MNSCKMSRILVKVNNTTQRGNETLKANVNTDTALKEVSGLLRGEDLILAIEIEKRPNFITLIVATDKKEVQFATDTKEKMIDFLEQLMEIIPPFHRYDIDDLIEDLTGGETE